MGKKQQISLYFQPKKVQSHCTFFGFFTEIRKRLKITLSFLIYYLYKNDESMKKDENLYLNRTINVREYIK